MKGLVILSFLLINITNGLAQRVPEKTLIPNLVDSIRLNVLRYRDKEMSLPGNEEEIRDLIGTTRLNDKESKKFIKQIGKKSAYVFERALLNHHSLEFTCYLNGSIALDVEISTLTRNISMYKAGADPFYGKISKKMGNYLVKLLMRLNLYTQLHEIGDTEGIDH